MASLFRRRSSDTVRSRRRQRLREELEDAGIRISSDSRLVDGVIAELDYARHPYVHEGRLPTYGAVVVDSPIDPSEHGWTISLEPDDDGVLRHFADGRNAFALRTPERLQLLLIEIAHDREAALVGLRDLLEPYGAVIVQRTTTGLVRMLTSEGLSIWDGARWWTKPYAARFADAVHAAHPDAPADRLHEILDFCVHTMSPAEAGTTLVWAHGASGLDDVPGLSASQPPTVLPPLPFSSRAARAAIRQLLSQVDGAAILDNDGNLVAVGAQLRSSATSHERLQIEPGVGSRHASARRYSFDHRDVLVFVVSRDGPVTVFARGETITSIHTQGDHTEAGTVAKPTGD
jgi:hypothetical protein